VGVAEREPPIAFGAREDVRDSFAVADDLGGGGEARQRDGAIDARQRPVEVDPGAARRDRQQDEDGEDDPYGNGADLRTSSNVVTPWATLVAPETRSGRMPALYAACVSAAMSICSTIRRLISRVTCMIS
jgi:hypothetical protein